MTTFKHSIILSGAVALTLCGNALADPKSDKKPGDYFEIESGDIETEVEGAKSVSFSDFIGRIDIATHDGPMQAMFYGVREDFVLTGEERGGVLYVKGPERLSMDAINRKFWRRGGDFDDRMDAFLKNYPRVKILVPRGASVSIDDSVTSARGGNIGGDLKIDGGIVAAEFGDVANAFVDIDGAGDVMVGEIVKMLDLNINGSGDFEAVSAAKADLAVNGSGDIDLGDIDGAAKARINGSGDISVADVDGPLSLAISGSGDVETGAAKQGASISINGSGDVSMISVNGPTTATVSGNGDIEIAGGRAENLNVTISGSGDFSLAGVSTNLTAKVGGSGAVSVKRNEGALAMAGDGDIIIGGVNKNEKKRKRY